MGDSDDPILAYWKWMMTLPTPWQWPWDDYQKKDKNRKEIHNKFPYTITLEANTDKLFDMEQWCWDKFGPKSGKCEKEECWHDAETNLKYNDSVFLLGLQTEDYIPPDSGEHKHDGDWTTVWALKTSYEAGFCDFCFKYNDQAVFFKLTFGF